MISKLIAGVMAISDFPMAPQMAYDLAGRVGHLVLRFDALNGDKAIFKECVRRAQQRTHVHGLRSRERWNRWNWREHMIRALDPIKPSYVLFLDADEAYSAGFEDDFRNFMDSGADMMMFDYQMAVCDQRKPKKYPGARHCKAFRWAPQVGYRPYKGYAKPTFANLGKKQPTVFNAATPILHYCFYTEAMEREKMNNLHK